MKILLTGARGQVGRALVERFKQDDNHFELLPLGREALDITDADAVWQTVNAFKPDLLINAAAYTSVDRAESEAQLCFAVNQTGAEHLAKASTAVGAVMIQLSTDYVFDGQSASAYLESDCPAPLSVYGASKLAGEQAVAETCPRHVILRTSWVFGEHGSNFVRTMLRLASSRRELNLVADQVGGPTYAGDLADALLTMALKVQTAEPDWGIYHYCGAPQISWYDFSQQIFSHAKAQGLLASTPRLNAITANDYGAAAKRPANSRLNCDKIQRTFGISPSNWQAALNNLSSFMPGP
jgi:dTDP-4-dehydrorhamnose reductase